MAETAEKVVALPRRDEKVFNIEWTVNIGKDRQARVMTDFPQGSDIEAFNAGLDIVDRALTRQKARHEIAEIEEMVEQAEDQLSQWRGDHEEAEKDHLKKLTEIEERSAHAKRLHDDTEHTARQEHARTEKRGEFVAKGTVRQALDRYVQIEAKANDEKARLEAERDQALSTLKINIKGNEKLIARLKRKIDQKKAVLGAGA